MFRQGYPWYLNQFPALGPDQICVEKSPSYFVTLKVPERIKEMNPRMKLILIGIYVCSYLYNLISL